MTTTETPRFRFLPAGRSGLQLTLDRVFQGLPGVAHGGSVLAAFDEAAALEGTRRLVGQYRRRVPLATPLDLQLEPSHASVRYCLYDAMSTALLVEGRIEPAELPAAPASCGLPRDSPLPVSTTCFVCGVENPAGLRARLWFDDTAVGGSWTPAARFRDGDGRLATLALLALLDEAAFWLGALACGESGMTTHLAVTLGAAVPINSALIVRGERADVQPSPDDPRYWTTSLEAHDGTGRMVAAAAITFVAVRGAARKLAAWVAPLNSPDVLRRIFPAYA